ncbi:MAG: phosphate ABC transporter substrate-binding protein PstS [Streptosporangiales bacterium]|nr:phosphate ABC transporter substrate-binding protein PstS [Streptosporangiales bacterium]
MKLLKYRHFAGFALVGALALAGCGTDETTAGGSTAAPPGGDINCAEGQLRASGSSAQANAMSAWTKAYQQACQGTTINYQSVGSGAGREQFLGGQTDFAGSDAALDEEEAAQANSERCDGANAINLPMVTGPIAIAYNLPGVDELVLDAQTIAGIFSNKIKTWNDPAIAKLNPDANLPNQQIQAFHRSDESGTTENFTAYLGAAAGNAWTYEVADTWSAPGGQAAKGSEGVSSAVQQNEGAISYMEYSYAKNLGLGTPKIDTGASEPVELTPETAAKTVETAEFVGEGNDLKLEIDYATQQEGAYPIVLVTYEIVCESNNAPDKVELLKSFLGYTVSEQGQQELDKIGYAPLSEEVAQKVRQSVDAIA